MKDFYAIFDWFLIFKNRILLSMVALLITLVAVMKKKLGFIFELCIYARPDIQIFKWLWHVTHTFRSFTVGLNDILSHVAALFEIWPYEVNFTVISFTKHFFLIPMYKNRSHWFEIFIEKMNMKKISGNPFKIL